MIWSLLYWLWIGFDIAWLVWLFCDNDAAYYIRNTRKVDQLDKKRYFRKTFWPLTNFVVAYNILCITAFVLKWWVF